MVLQKVLKYAEIKEGNEVIEGLEERISGRYTAEDIVDPNTGEVIS